MMHFFLTHPITCLWLAFCAGVISGALIVREPKFDEENSLPLNQVASQMRKDFARNTTPGEKNV